MAYWLLKTEPSIYSFSHLEKDKKAVWDGVSNHLALKHIRAMAAGDLAFIYHTAAEKQVVGVARFTSPPYPDPKQKDPRLVVIDLKPVERLRKPVPLVVLKADKQFADFLLVRMARLSVMPVSPAHWKAILALSH